MIITQCSLIPDHCSSAPLECIVVPPVDRGVGAGLLTVASAGIRSLSKAYLA